MKYNVPLVIKDNDSLSMLLNKISPGSTVLEFGCANGRMTKYMKEVLSCDVYIVEIDKEAFTEACQYAVDGICGDISLFEWLSAFSSKKFNYIIFADVLEHLRDPVQILEKTQKLLRDDGSILVSLPNIAHNDIIAKLLEGSFEYTPLGLLDDTHIRFFAPESIGAFCESAGYVITSKEYVTKMNTETEQYDYSPYKLNSTICSELYRNYKGVIYQFILVLHKQQYAIQNKLVPQETSPLPININSSYYINNGSGFSENCRKFCLSKSDYTGLFTLRINLNSLKDIKGIRIDPVEGQLCIIEKVSVGNQNDCHIEYSESIRVSPEYILCCTEDPYILINITSLKLPQIVITVRFRLLDTSVIYKLSDMVTECEKKTLEIDTLEREIFDKEQANSVQEKEISELNKSITSLRLEKTESAVRNRQLERKLQELTVILSNKQRQIADMECERKSLNNTIDLLRSKLSITAKTIESISKHFA